MIVPALLGPSEANRWTLKRKKALCDYIIMEPDKGVKFALSKGLSGDEIILMVRQFKTKGIDGLRATKKRRKINIEQV